MEIFFFVCYIILKSNSHRLLKEANIYLIIKDNHVSLGRSYCLSLFQANRSEKKIKVLKGSMASGHSLSHLG